MKTVCIVVPIYKEFVDLSEGEKYSLNQLYSKLEHHPICFIGPRKIDWEIYINGALRTKLLPKLKFFNSRYFANIGGYNNLLLSRSFYQSFKKFEYILIYQLDALVFKDELDYWCGKNYDYIGAPWFEGWGHAQNDSEIVGVGNGGFSLRKIKTFTRLLRRANFISFFTRCGLFFV